MSESDLIQKFKTNVLKSIKSPSPKLTRKRKLNDYDSNSDDSDLSESITESPHKKLRPSTNTLSEDDEFNELFEIEVDANTNITKPTPKPMYKSRSKLRNRYFNANDSETSEEDMDSMERMETKLRTRPKNITFKCYNCDESGHIARNCPYETVQICFKCGESGHSGFYCSNNICSLCLKAHPIHECHLFTANKHTFRYCIRCGSKEHYINKCFAQLNHRLTQLQCFVCGKYGHLNCKSSANQSLRVELCSNCGSEGHTFAFCHSLKMNKAEIAIGLSTGANDPNICFNCNGPNHHSRNCPLIIRSYQKKQRAKKGNSNSNSKFHYRKGSNNSLKHRFRRQSSPKNKREMSKSKTEHLKLIKQRNKALMKVND